MSFEQPEQPVSKDTPPTASTEVPTSTTIDSQTNGAMSNSSAIDSGFTSTVKQTNGATQPNTEDITIHTHSISTADTTSESPPSGTDVDFATSNSTASRDVDPQIIEALRGKDRIYVLKLGELMEGLILDERRQRIELTPATSYQRLLVHRCSAYYKLTPESDQQSKGIFVYSTTESRVPDCKISELVPPETSTQPTFKIMRRLSTWRNRAPHQSGSVTGEDGDVSDPGPSEAGSLGGRSTVTGGGNKKHMTIEEREAAYKEARSRIFLGFEEKEKGKDKDVDSSTSSLGTSSSTMQNGGMGPGETESSGSSPATESEWAGPPRRSGCPPSGYASASSSTRSSIRSSAYISNGSGSSRNSRAASPSAIPFATLYEPAAAAAMPYDVPQHQHSAPTGPMYHAPYGYPYNQAQPNPQYASYQYYPPYPPPPYTAPPHAQQNISDAAPPSNGEHYPPPHIPYPQYMWPHLTQPPVHSPPPMQHPVSTQPLPNQPHVMSPPPGQPSYQTYMSPPPHAYTYPMTTGYYVGQPGPIPPPPGHPPHLSGPQLYGHRSPNCAPNSGPMNSMNSMNSLRNGLGHNGVPPPVNGRPLPSHHISNGSGSKGRNGPTQPGRAPWSFGPGIGSGGFTTTTSHSNDNLPPRLNNNRRQNNMSNSSMNSRSTSGDEVSSVTSSTSSSSRRTSAVRGSHPLPARPDWAINIKPQINRTIPPISPPRSISGSSAQSNFSARSSYSNSPVPLQSTDFPPLSGQPVDRRVPGPTGAWGNPTNRTLFGQTTESPSNVRSNSNIDNRLDDSGFDRPTPKSSSLYNPNNTRQSNPVHTPQSNKAQYHNGKQADGERGILVKQMDSLSLQNNTPKMDEPEPSSTAAAIISVTSQ